MTTTAPQGSRLGDTTAAVLTLVTAAAAWALSTERMGGMEVGPGGALGELDWFAVSWLVMMAAMMLPAATPMIAAYGRHARRSGATAAFAVGYLAAWAAAGLLAYAVIEAVRSLDMVFLAWEEAGRLVAAAVIAGADLYQLTTPKRACLRHCRERDAFLAERWRTGHLSAIRMGGEYGAFCIGCSLALTAALFALGWMSLTWMALVAALIAAERMLQLLIAPSETLARHDGIAVAHVLVDLTSQREGDPRATL